MRFLLRAMTAFALTATAYLQMALACDLDNPLGKAACAANPPVIRKR